MANEFEPAPVEIFCQAGGIDEPATTVMNVTASLDPVTGLPPVDPKSLQPPAPLRIPKPVFETVFLSGTVSNATDSKLELTAISISPHVPREVRLLAGPRVIGSIRARPFRAWRTQSRQSPVVSGHYHWFPGHRLSRYRARRTRCCGKSVLDGATLAIFCLPRIG